MGKESQLLEAARNGNLPKVESRVARPLLPVSLLKLLGKKRKHLSSSTTEGGEENDHGAPDWSCADVVAEAEKLTTTSVDVNCVDSNSSTPLILAALHGHRNVLRALLLYSANVNAEDYLGNTALHMAAWHSRSDIIDVLLPNGADINKRNYKGCTALHFAVQHCVQGKLLTVSKLLQGRARIDIKNLDGDTALDLAAQYDKREVVSMLLDSSPDVVTACVRPLVFACQLGRMEMVEILLEAGMDPNMVDDRSGTSPLHEAMRFYREDIAKLLLSFGANPDSENRQNETPRTIVSAMPGPKGDKFALLFDDSLLCERRVPKVYRERAESIEDSMETDRHTSIVYPRLFNRPWWTANDKIHCSSPSPDHPCTALLDGSLDTFWLIPEAGGYNWVVFDFGAPFLLNGVRVYGWEDTRTVRQFIVETGETLCGPWTKVGKYCYDLIRPEDPDELAPPQDFRGFYGVSQYWKLTVCSNYGNPQTRVRGVQFYGIEEEVLDWFHDLNAMKYCKQFVEKGYNQLSDVARLDEEAIKQVVSLPGHQKKLMISIRQLREKCAMLTRLEWSRTPPTLAAVGEPLPSFSVRGDPYSQDRVKLIVHGGAQVFGETVVSMVPQEGKKPSKAHFTGITLSPAGKYWLEVQCERIPFISVKSVEPITVELAPKRGEELDKAFADIESLLIF